ncbi:MAG TPA: prenyltransferase/squalene oxidase repeat-containing protein [Planctomycetota bacterium]|nr:prenyltransferase/squalene oxidase repeat-containing protein [Planctomycetota bacterium]
MQGSTSLAVSMRTALRSSPWLVIALALHGVVLATLSVIYVAQHRVPSVEVLPQVYVRPPTRDFPLFKEPEPPPPEVRAPVPKDTVVDFVPEDQVVPDFTPLATEPVDLHEPVGDPSVLDGLPGGASGGTSIGTGTGGHAGTGTPSPIATVRLGGGSGIHPGHPPEHATAGTEAAVLDGLCWLARHQNQDGSWSAGSLAEHCTLGHACVSEQSDFSPQYDAGLTGLALLAFLGHGLDQNSRAGLIDQAMGKRHDAGDVVGRGLRWLMSEQGPDGAFGNYAGSLYNEAIGALAFSEAYCLSRNAELKECAERSVRYLVAAQKSNPTGSGRWGWRYTPGGDSVADTSVTGWAVMALKSAQLAGLPVPAEAWEGALSFTQWVTGADGLVGYLDPSGAGSKVTGRGDNFDYHVGTMSALGMLVRTFATHDVLDPFLEQGARRLVQDLPAAGEDGLGVDYYYWYYGTLALNQFDGPDSPRADRGRYWKPWNEAMMAALLALQDHETARDVCSRGGWLTPDRWSHSGGPIYSTALNVLTLEVYYRYPNAFGSKVEAAAPAEQPPKAASLGPR